MGRRGVGSARNPSMEKKKKKMKRRSEDMERRGGGSARNPSMEKKKNKMMKRRSEMLAGIDSSRDTRITYDTWEILLMDKAESDHNRELAQKALQLYKEREGVEFEAVEALFLESAWLHVRGAGFKHIDSWSHMSFTAKPRNGDCNEASSLKYFFTELMKDRDTDEFIVMYCSTFDPSKDEGNAHGCAICPLKVKFHPDPNGYMVGRPPYHNIG